VSDISFQFPWWVDVVFALTYAFWPLTIAAAGAVIWLYLARTSRAARVVAIVIGVPWVVSAGSNLWLQIDAARSHAAGVAYERAHRQTLASDTVVSGMHLPANTVLVTDDAFHLSSLELSKPTVLFGVPLQDTVSLQDAKLDGSQTLQHDATIDGLPCAADGASTSFANGRLTNCKLAHPATIRGVPCQGYVTIQEDFFGCELAAPYQRYGATWYQGTDVRGNDADITFTIGSRPSSLRVYGSPLSKGTMVNYQNGAVAMLTLNTPLRYRGCTITSIERRDGAMTGEVDGPCSLRALPNGRVALPNL
jgi:hypothetical protein